MDDLPKFVNKFDSPSVARFSGIEGLEVEMLLCRDGIGDVAAEDGVPADFKLV